MTNKKYQLQRRYTLVELMVAMAVFSLLLVLSMQIFSGVQTVWARSEQKNETFASARIAMEFVAARLQNISYSDETPMLIYADGDNHNIFFPTAMPMTRQDKDGKALDHHSIRFLHFGLSKKEKSGEVEKPDMLEMKIFGASKAATRSFSRLVPPYDTDTGLTDAVGKVKNRFSKYSNLEDYDVIPLVRNIVSFKLTPYNANLAAVSIPSAGYPNHSQRQMPYMIEIEITMLDSAERYKEWADETDDAKKKDIVQQYGYTFRRAVLIGDGRAL